MIRLLGLEYCRLGNGAVDFEMIEDAYMDCPMRRRYLQQQVQDLDGFVVYYP